MSDKEDVVIEYPAAGATYPADGEPARYGVYAYGVYEPSSVLAGKTKRTNLGVYDSLEEAQREHPEAKWYGEGSGYEPVNLPENAPDWFDEANAGEHWGEDY